MTEPHGMQLLAIRLANALGKPLGLNFFPRAFPNTSVEHAASRADIFDGIYRSNFWASAESRSGLGSETVFASAYRTQLRALLISRNLQRIFDAPCGDLNWMLPLAREDAVSYQGRDISEALISDLRQRFPELDLRVFDVCQDPFPAADVWHCRDCLFHLPFADIRRALENFVRSEVRYALLTTHSARLHRNLDVTAGGFRYLDLERAPIRLPRAQVYLRDYRAGRDFPRYVALWSREQIGEALERWPI